MTRPGRSPALAVEVFGGPTVSGPDGTVDLTPAQRALVAVVYSEGDVSRPRLGGILWEDGGESRVRHRIRQLLHQTNGRFGIECVVAVGDDLRGSPEFDCDVERFRSAVGAGRLREAASLIEKGLAPRARDWSARFDAWARTLQSRLRRELVRAAHEKWGTASAESRWADARDAAECLYLLAPDDEESIARAIESRGRVDRLGSAEAAYAGYLDSLDGAEPHRRIRALIERFREVRGVVDRRGEGPFVGRRDALAEGREALDRAREGAFTFYLVTGESGIGKTRLLRELQREAVLRDFRCLKASPTELERRIPLNPLLDALRAVDLGPHLEAIGEPWRSVVAATLPPGAYDEWAGTVPPIQDTSLPRRLLDAYSLLLERIALERPTVLFLDDLQWADATTVAALQFFQRRWPGGSFAIVASLRSGLVDFGEPVAQYLERAEGLDVTRHDLGDMSDHEAAMLVRGLVEGTDEVPVGRLCELAGPHPLYLTEVTRDYLAGRLVLPEQPAGQVLIPVSLQQLLKARLVGLSDRAFRIARILSVGARTLRLADIAQLSACSLDQCADFVEELEQARLVAVEKDRVRVSHDLFRSAIYSGMSESRRALLHRSLAEHLQSEPSTAPGELAIHFLRGGESALAAENGWTAGDRASESGAMAEAAYFYGLVVECEDDPDRRADATANLGRALHLNRDLERANPVLELAASRLRARGRRSDARRLEIRRVEGLAAVGAVPVPDLIGRLESIKYEAREEQDWEAVALALNTELRLRNRSGDLEGIRRAFGDLADSADRGSPEADVLSQAGLAMQAMFANPQAGLVAARRAVSLGEYVAAHRLTALIRLLVVLLYQGKYFTTEGAEALEEARRLAERGGDRWAKFGIENNHALAVSDLGDSDRARVLMEQAARLLGSGDLDIPRFNLANNRAELELTAGEYAVAASWYEAAQEHINCNAPRYATDLVHAGLGLCALESGDLREARKRENSLGTQPELWFFDPTVILTFRARMLERRGQRLTAIQLLREQAGSIEERLVMPWFKLSACLAQLLTKAGSLEDAVDVASRAKGRADALHLTLRSAQFDRLSVEARQRL